MGRAARLSHDGRVQIPADIRRALDLKEGQRFAVVPKGDHISLVPVPELDDLLGIAEGHLPQGYRDRS